jgi:TRAP-type transport system periplasmic protein
MKYWRIIGLAAVLFAATAGAKAQDTILRIGDIVAPGSVQAEATEHFAEIVNNAGVGLEVRIFHGSQLGSGPVQIQNVSIGGQEMFIGGLALFANYSEDLRIAETPFTFVSREHFELWVNSEYFEPILDEVIQNGNQRIINTELLWRRGPFRVMLAKNPVLDLEDLSTTKLRVPESEVFNRFWGEKGLGAVPVTLPFGEVYLGLRQGVVDAVTTPFDLVVSMKFGEVAKHLMDLRPFWQMLPMAINEDTWQSLNEEQQATLIRAANEAGEFFNQKVDENVDAWREELTGMDVIWHEVDRTPFVERINEKNRQWTEEGYWREGLIEEIDSMRP